jgi:hypothetical protein
MVRSSADFTLSVNSRYRLPHPARRTWYADRSVCESERTSRRAVETPRRDVPGGKRCVRESNCRTFPGLRLCAEKPNARVCHCRVFDIARSVPPFALPEPVPGVCGVCGVTCGAVPIRLELFHGAHGGHRAARRTPRRREASAEDGARSSPCTAFTSQRSRGHHRRRVCVPLACSRTLECPWRRAHRGRSSLLPSALPSCKAPRTARSP